MALVLAGASAMLTYYFYEKIKVRDYDESGAGAPYVGDPSTPKNFYPLTKPLAFNCPDVAGKAQKLNIADRTWRDISQSFATVQYYAQHVSDQNESYYRWVWYDTFLGWNGFIFPQGPRSPNFTLTAAEMNMNTDNGGPEYCK